MTNVLPFPSIDPPTTVGGVLACYLAHTRHEQDPRTYEDRKRVLTEFEGSFGHVALAAAKPYHLQIWVDAQRDRWASAWTRKRVIGGIQAAFNWCAKLGIIATNPFRGVTCEAGEHGQPMEPAEFQAMLRSTTAPFRRFLIALRFSGARPGEIASAEWAHLDVARSCLESDKHKTYRKTRKLRRIILHPVALKLLAWIKRNQPDERYIFTNSRGGPWTRTAISWRLEQIREKAGINRDITCYGLRHLYAVQAVLNGVDVLTLCPLMGHERIATTQYYADVATRTDHLKGAVEKIFGPRPKT